MTNPRTADCADDAPAPRPRRAQRLWEALWQQPLYAIAFALFFGTLYGGTRSAYWAAFKISLVFAYVIRLALVALKLWGLPWLRRMRGPGVLPIRIEAPAYLVTSVVSSYVAAALIQAFVMPGFLGSPEAVLRSGAYSVLFAITIGGVAYAIAFYRQSMTRARAIEHMRAELASAELRALRAQIQPHFLFNTLNTIAALVRESPAEAEDTVTRLADMFRHTLRASEQEHRPLTDELEFVRAYLEIERTRFGTRLRIQESIEPGLDGFAVPGLMLQPLVENAVRYAVSPRAEGATIGIVARRDGDVLVLEVVDDGPGMSAAADPGGNGFGLHSVRERLRAAGPPHALEITSAPGHGARITITLPLRPTSTTTPAWRPS